MSFVEKHNPLKGSVLSKKRDETKGDGRKAEISEITYQSVKEDAIQFGLATDVLYQMNSGKEASIYLAMWKDHPIILKAYRLWHSSHKMSKKKGYVASGTSKRSHCIYAMIEDLAVIEYDILMNSFKAGVHVPTPISRVGNYLTMRFIGDELDPAPQLKYVELENPEVALDQILDDYLIMYRDSHYVHGDLSRYNILWWQNRPWIIDVPQAYLVNPWADMKKAESLLRRDLKNVLSYFDSYGINRDLDHILGVFLAAYTPHNLRHYKELQTEGGEL